MNYILFDGPYRSAMLPFTFTRPVAEIRFGILTIREKWQKFLGNTITTVTEDYLSAKFPMVEMDCNIMINASYSPCFKLSNLIKKLGPNQAIFDKEDVVAFYSKSTDLSIDLSTFEAIEIDFPVLKLEHSWDIFSKNAAAIALDFNLITSGRNSQAVPEHCSTVNPSQIFIEEGAQLSHCVLNATDGPIYIGKDTKVMEGSLIRGPFALCENATIKMGAKIYGPTTIGPHCKLGGEVNNVVLFGYSNKAHDGFLGNSVIGEWCNIGADSNNSNLKNNYAEVRMWNYTSEKFIKTGLQFCGLMMGDHSKCAINTMFNTGTVVGVNANIFGAGFPRNFIPSFSWGGAKGFKTYSTEKAFEVASIVLSRRGLEFNALEAEILNHVFELTKDFRKNT